MCVCFFGWRSAIKCEEQYRHCDSIFVLIVGPDNNINKVDTRELTAVEVEVTVAVSCWEYSKKSWVTSRE